MPVGPWSSRVRSGVRNPLKTRGSSSGTMMASRSSDKIFSCSRMGASSEVYAAAFENNETWGAAFTAAQRGSIAVLKSRRAQLERRLGGGSVVARDTPQRREQLQLAPQLHPLPPPQGLREGPMTPPRDDPWAGSRAPVVLGRLSTRSGTVEPYPRTGSIHVSVALLRLGHSFE